MKYFIVGNGFIGNKFLTELKNGGEEAHMSTVDASDYVSLKNEIQREAPDVVINCAGRTGRPNIDWCEDHKMETVTGNITVPLVIARICDELDIYFVHFSTGCIYNGDNGGNGFTEKDEPNFTDSFYSFTKYHTEKLLIPFKPLILRLRMPFDGVPSPRNYVNKLTSFKKVIDIPNSVTIVPELIDCSIKMIKDKRRGIYNMTNPGALRYPELFEMYKEIIDPNFTYDVLTLEELMGQLKTGRSNCILDPSKRESEGYTMTEIHEALPILLEKYKQNS